MPEVQQKLQGPRRLRLKSEQGVNRVRTESPYFEDILTLARTKSKNKKIPGGPFNLAWPPSHQGRKFLIILDTGKCRKVWVDNKAWVKNDSDVNIPAVWRSLSSNKFWTLDVVAGWKEIPLSKKEKKGEKK